MKQYLFLILFSLFFNAIKAQDRNLLEQKRKQINQNIAKTTQEIDKTKKTKVQTATQAQNAKKLLQKQSQKVATINKEVANINEIISRKTEIVASLELDLLSLKNDYGQLLYLLYKYKKNYPSLLNWIGYNQFEQSYTRQFYLLKIEAKTAEKLSHIQATQQSLRLRQDELMAAKINKSKLLQNEQNAQQKLAKTTQEKENQLKTLHQRQKRLETQLAQSQKDKQTLNNKIESVIKNELSLAKNNSKVNSQGAKTSPQINPSANFAPIAANPQLNSQFAANKGKFKKPANGQIVAQFGKIVHSEVPLIVTYNNGIDIKTASNATVQAIFNGQVVSVFVVPSMGNAVMLKHGEFYTIYANLAAVHVKRGEQVKTNQAVGTVGKDSQTGNFILHFELWRGKNKENPSLWLN